MNVRSVQHHSTTHALVGGRTGLTVSMALPLLLAMVGGATSAARADAIAGTSRPAALQHVGIDQTLNAQVPPDLSFRDEYGRDVRLGQYFDGRRPVVLALVYYECPMLCTVVLNDLTRAMNSMKLSCGDQFQIVTVSFDPSETPKLALDKKQQYIRAYRRPQADEGWHFLTGDEPAIRQLTAAVGFRYAWDSKFRQYAHASGLIILTPDGRTARYFYGLEYPPNELEQSLADASVGRSTSVSAGERVLLFCFHYDPSTGRYSLAINRVVQAGGCLTVLVLAAYIALSLRRDRARRPATATAMNAR